MKLEHYIASQTPLSRRKILDHLTKGEITINNEVVDDLTQDVSPGKDMVCIGNTVLTERVSFLYYKVYKPMHVITTLSDPKGRTTIKDVFPQLPENVFPVGRLDRKSTGLLLFTNDGQFSNKIQHPEYKVKKTYHVSLDRPLSDYDKKHFEAGVMLEDGPVRCNSMTKVGKQDYTVVVGEGRNRVVRRMFDFLDYTVRELRRTAIGTISLGDLKPGEVKKLSKKDIDHLFD